MHRPPRKQELLAQFRRSLVAQPVRGPTPLKDGVRAGVDPSAWPKAAIGLLVRESPEDRLEFLLTLRSPRLKWHAGQVALPGGVREESDGTFLRTLDRELEEEAGLPAGGVEWVDAPWDTLLSLHGVEVHPFLGFLRPDAASELRLQDTEVAEAAWVDFDALFDPARWASRAIIPSDVQRAGPRGYVDFPIWLGWRHVTWGLTARAFELFVRRISGRAPLELASETPL